MMTVKINSTLLGNIELYTQKPSSHKSTFSSCCRAASAITQTANINIIK